LFIHWEKASAIETQSRAIWTLAAIEMREQKGVSLLIIGKTLLTNLAMFKMLSHFFRERVVIQGISQKLLVIWS
jgi:hypothetical protein